MNLFRFLMRISPSAVLLMVLSGLISGASSVGLLAVIHTALTAERTLVWYWAGLFAGLCLLVLVTKVLSQAILIRLSHRAVSSLSLQLSQQILAAPLRHLELLGPHRLLATLTGDAATVIQAVNALPGLTVSVVVLCCCLGYLGWLSLPVLGVVLVFLIVGLLTYTLVVRWALGRLRLARKGYDGLVKHFRGLVEGIKELKLNRKRRQAFVEESLRGTLTEIQEQGIRGMTLFTFASSWGRFLFLLLIGCVLFVVPLLYTVDRVTLSGYVLTILFVVQPLESIMSLFPVIGRALAAVAAVQSLQLALDVPRNESEDGAYKKTGDGAFEQPWQRLELRGITHRYREEQRDGFQLGPVDLHLEPGELVFLVGGNGSGKTTLAKLLVGLYAPDSGEIRVDGTGIGQEERDDYRQLFSAVFADCHLFDRLLGLNHPDLGKKAEGLLRQLGLEGFVQVEDGRLSTTNLSRGQQKRLALLTAYLEDRDIFVLDEWAADQDPTFREFFYTTLLPDLKKRGKAVLVITHDERYYHLADRLIRLVDGQRAKGKPIA
jgi:putative ATP-binding cassette transporter